MRFPFLKLVAIIVDNSFLPPPCKGSRSETMCNGVRPCFFSYFARIKGIFICDMATRDFLGYCEFMLTIRPEGNLGIVLDSGAETNGGVGVIAHIVRSSVASSIILATVIVRICCAMRVIFISVTNIGSTSSTVVRCFCGMNSSPRSLPSGTILRNTIIKRSIKNQSVFSSFHSWL